MQEQYLGLKRRLEEHGLPSAPSPTPSIVSDSSDVSSVDHRRGTVLRKPSKRSSRRSASEDSEYQCLSHSNSQTYFLKEMNKNQRKNNIHLLFCSGYGFFSFYFISFYLIVDEENFLTGMKRPNSRHITYRFCKGS